MCKLFARYSFFKWKTNLICGNDFLGFLKIEGTNFIIYVKQKLAKVMLICGYSLVPNESVSCWFNSRHVLRSFFSYQMCSSLFRYVQYWLLSVSSQIILNPCQMKLKSTKGLSKFHFMIKNSFIYLELNFWGIF